eukprot:CAMPEP_0184315310 /NCGR_PEP_ID=MMETSP1049-20130417/81365_1 /TAXON_ID=77928 /ORGANISM="Proteomonas sulcata, Strain CCMP704" /LENGTH=56 /DNA_ID=CAMNT_0026633705 /DNA_START=502 /DNA_END=672 /DNA_ORIENTATION=+
MYRESGLTATDVTPSLGPSSSPKVLTQVPVAISHSLAHLSPEPETMYRPSILKSTE